MLGVQRLVSCVREVVREWEGVAEPLHGMHVARGFTPLTHSSALELTLRTRRAAWSTS